MTRCFGELVMAVAICLVCGSTAVAQVQRPVLDGWQDTVPLDRTDRYLVPVALTPPPDRPVSSTEGNLPFYLGEKFRYQNLTVWARFWVSLLGTTIHFLEWDETDWMWFGLTVGGTLALMAPTDPSPDARLQFWIQPRRTRVMDGVFWRLTTERFSAFGIGLVGASALAGWIGGWPEITEWASLMWETLGIVQIHHVAQKLMIGRESPYDGDGLGIIHGPSQGYKLFPSGTPSGHTASVFALTTLTMDYFDLLWLDIVGYTLYGYICASVLYNNQHFISDVVWGAPLGYFLGKWVVRHRSSKYRYVHGEPMRIGTARFVGFAPFVDPDVGVTGLAATWTW